MRFEEVYGLREGKRLKPSERWCRHLVFALRVLDDYARTGSVMRFVVEMSGLRIPQAMQKPMHDYEQFAKDRRHLRMSTLQERMHAIAVFLDFLRSRGVMALDRMQADDISAFITSRSNWKPRTVSHVASHLRSFLQIFVSTRNLAAGLQLRSSDDPGRAPCHGSVGVGPGTGRQTPRRCRS